jgi:5'-deoxynucleotidase YfbR-like HD superfamily hydrolase
MRNDVWDELNRGFHLEYYGDIPFDLDDPNSMNHLDPMDPPDEIVDCSITFKTLRERVLKHISDEYYAMFDIELYTLCSLAQHRHSVGRLGQRKRDEVLQLIDRVGECGSATSALVPYLAMIRENLSQDSFPIGRVYQKLMRLKTAMRQGWIEAGVSGVRLESVSEHMLGTVYLARVFLPASLHNEPQYDRREIIQLLLYHDVGEYKDGDKVSIRKTAFDTEAEGKAIQYLQACGTYVGISDLEDLYDSWRRFEYPDSINGRIAQEIDKLEFLAQLGEYKNVVARTWLIEKKNAVRQSIQSEVGKAIFRALVAAYELA